MNKLYALSYKRLEQFFDADPASSARGIGMIQEKAFVYSIIDRESKKPVEYILPVPRRRGDFRKFSPGFPEAVKTYFKHRCEGARGTSAVRS